MSVDIDLRKFISELPYLGLKDLKMQLNLAEKAVENATFVKIIKAELKNREEGRKH